MTQEADYLFDPMNKRLLDKNGKTVKELTDEEAEALMQDTGGNKNNTNITRNTSMGDNGKEFIRKIRRASNRILDDYSTDTLEGKGLFSLGGSHTGNQEWTPDIQRLEYLERDTDNPSSLLEIYKTADKLLKGDAPLEVKAELALTMKRNARRLAECFFIQKERREELFRRRNELEKDNYFRAVFVCAYIWAEIYPRFYEPIITKAKQEGRYPEEDSKAEDRFFEEIQQDDNALFATLAKEYGEESIRQKDEELAEDYLPADLRDAIQKAEEERGKQHLEERKKKMAKRREVWRERQAEGDTPAC